MIAVDRLPPEIRASVRAVVWRSVAVPGREKPTKVPYIPSRPAVKANVSDPRTWGTFVAALAAVQAGKADGPGIVLGDGLVGVDLDECRDPCTGTIAPEALAIIQTLDSYTELSPSRTGLHILARGTLPPGGRRKAGVEMYAEGRFFTVTGMHVVGTPTTIEERTAELAALHARVFGQEVKPLHRPARPLTVVRDDAALLDRARAARNGAKFAALWRGDWSGYPSQSEADQALCNLLAFWTGADAARVDRLFRRSGLMRRKWDDQRGEQTYGERTVATAVAGCDVYGGARVIG